MQEVDIYAVGLLRDLKSWRSGRWTFLEFFGWFRKSWTRKSYWNGYLAESDSKARCGTGWTKSRALNSWKRIPEL
jgi:hypothetical protein